MKADATYIQTDIINNYGELTERDISTNLDANYYKGMDNHGTRTLVQIGNIDTKGNNSIWGRVYDPEGIAPTLNSEGGGLGAKTGLYMVQRPRGFNKGGQRKLPCLTDNNYHQNNFLGGIRRLTPMECERLQGFPDRWTEGISDTQRYKCLGNAISVPVAVEIFKKLKQAICLLQF